MSGIFTLLFISIVVGVVLSLMAFVSAFRAWLSFRRVRIVFQTEVIEEIARLSSRTTELERGVNRLNVRASELPVTISRLQNSIAILQILTGNLALTLRQTTRVLNFASLKTLSSTRLGKSLGQILDGVRR